MYEIKSRSAQGSSIFFIDSVLNVADNTCIQPQFPPPPLKTHTSEEKSQQIQTRDVEGPFDHIRTCICSPSQITFSVGTS